MNIDTPLRELGPIDSTVLREAILAQDDDAWKEDKYRQEEFEVHHATESIVALFVDLDKWPDIVVKREPGWPRIAEAALPLMNDIISNHYPPGGTVIRAMAAKLLAGGIINPHTDRHPSFHVGHRLHIPRCLGRGPGARYHRSRARRDRPTSRNCRTKPNGAGTRPTGGTGDSRSLV